MTPDDFDDQSWTCGMSCFVCGEWRRIVSVDFYEYKICVMVSEDEDDTVWVGCENVTSVLSFYEMN